MCSTPSSIPPRSVSDDFPLPPKLTMTALSPTKRQPVQLGAPQALVTRLKVSGTAAHSGSSHDSGVNAIQKTARVLELIQAAGVRRFGASFRAVVTEASSGKGFSQVPDAAELGVAIPLRGADEPALRSLIAAALARADQELVAATPSRVLQQSIQSGPLFALKSFAVNVDVRTTIAFPTRTAQAALKTIVRGSSSTAGLRSSMKSLESWPAFALPATSPLRRALERAASTLSPRFTPSTISGPSNVGNLLAAAGIPATTGYGVANRHANWTDESIELSSIPQVYAVYRQAVMSLLGCGEQEGAPACRVVNLK